VESEADRGVFRIQEDEQPASVRNLTQLARLADVILRENELLGRFVAASPGVLVLELPETERTFFHNGIVFAALDAFNDPIKNPTLTLLAEAGEE
jgi:hypothetical protein